ncbi:MAG: D-sedoheptulose-7-phosphate isomerase [Desulfobulbus sp.]
MQTLLTTNLARSIQAKEDFARRCGDDILRLAAWIQETFEAGGKLLIFGNGGSAADAQHLAAEFVNRFLIDRRPLPALALTTDSSILTAIGNDFGYDQVFVKQIQALGKAGDLALGISTSGNSVNVLLAMETARSMGLKTAALTGGLARPGGKLAPLCDLVLNVPSDATPHIQEAHLWVEHLLCEIVERRMFAT